MTIDSKKDAKQKKRDKVKEELSLEDKLLMTKIEELVDQITDLTLSTETTVKAINSLFTEVRKSTQLRTAIPKAMKFLKPHFAQIENTFTQLLDGPRKQTLADFLSFVSPSLKEKYDRDCLKYLLAGSADYEPEERGEEYVLALAGDLAAEFLDRLESGNDVDVVHRLAAKAMPFLFKSGSEIDAVDLLLEVERMDLLVQFVTEDNFDRIYNYLAASLQYTADNVEYQTLLKTLYEISIKIGKWGSALRVAIRGNSLDRIKEVFEKCQDPLLRKQSCFMLARHRFFFLGFSIK